MDSITPIQPISLQNRRPIISIPESHLLPLINDSSPILPILSPSLWIPRVLVLGPGGIKGLKTLGFLGPVEDAGLLEHIDTHGGVSIGAVISLLIICGYRIREIINEAVTLNLFKEITSMDPLSIIENKGFISTEPVRKHLIQLVINKFGNVPSLRGLYMMTGKSLVACTLNATDEVCVMMNPFDNPDVSCVDATMFSMNIPFVFYQLIHRGKIYVDGALANPYPIDYFDDNKTNILGIYIKTIQQKNNTIPRHPGIIIERVEDPIQALPISAYPLKIINAMMDQRRNDIIQHTSSLCKHVCLTVTNDDTLGHDITTEEKATLLVEGFNQGKLFIESIISNSYNDPILPDKLSYSYPIYYISPHDI